MYERQASNRVQQAIECLFSEDSRQQVLATLLASSGSERVHAAILALSFGDQHRLETLAETAKRDFRDVVICEEFPEEFLDGPARATAAAELARRYEAIGFPVPPHTAYWAKGA